MFDGRASNSFVAVPTGRARLTKSRAPAMWNNLFYGSRKITPRHNLRRRRRFLIQR